MELFVFSKHRATVDYGYLMPVHLPGNGYAGANAIRMVYYMASCRRWGDVHADFCSCSLLGKTMVAQSGLGPRKS